MPTILTHHGTRIVTLAEGEAIADHCRCGDIAIVEAAQGWWTHFVGADGSFDSYDEPFGSHHQAVCAAKAAAEFDGE